MNQSNNVGSKRFRFSLRLIPTIIFLFLLVILVWLGFWQLNRAKQKRILLVSYKALKTSQPVKITDIESSADIMSLRYTPIKLNGKFDNQHSILLDNKTHKGRVGYQVLSPFFPKDGRAAILINRGWIALGRTRNELPGIPAIKGEVNINGIIAAPKSNAFLLKQDQENGLQWPIRVQKVDTVKLSKLLGYKLYPFIVLLSPQSDYGFVRDWSPAKLNPHKNVGYAVQWFALALLLLILFIIVHIRRNKK